MSAIRRSSPEAGTALPNETGIPFEETGLVMKLVRECADDQFQNGRRDNSGNQCRD